LLRPSRSLWQQACKTVFHNTTPDLQDQDRDHSVQDQDRFFLVSDRFCPKIDGLRPHHWSKIVYFASDSLSHCDLTTPISEVRYLENWMSDVSILLLVSTSVFCKELFAIYDFELLTSCDLQILGQGQSKSNNVVPGLCQTSKVFYFCSI